MGDFLGRRLLECEKEMASMKHLASQLCHIVCHFFDRQCDDKSSKAGTSLGS